jgi:sugar phosphate isomerase/epimerase
MPDMTSNQIGVMLNNLERDRLRAFDVAAQLGFRIVHTSALPGSWLSGPERDQYKKAARDSGLTIASMFVGFDGQSYADIPTIRRTVGLVIPELRDHRRQVAKQYAALAHELGVPSLSGHIGFLTPPSDSEYAPLLDALRDILDCCAANGQTFHVETGQDPADVLRQFLRDVDRPNLGVNFDPGNFILYGTDEPLPALEVLAPYVRGVHCKDAIRSGRAGILGTEVPLGHGEVNFPILLARLRAHGYCGPLVIERESSVDPVADIIAARKLLTGLVAA